MTSKTDAETYRDHHMSRFPEFAAELREKGIKNAYVCAVEGAEPKAVEREWRMLMDRVEHGACTPLNPTVTEWIVAKYRIIKYRLFRAKKFKESLSTHLLTG